MMESAFLAVKFGEGLGYGAYVGTGTEEQRRRWGAVHAAVGLTGGQRGLLGGFTRRMHVLTVSGVWCGDCVEQVPMLDHIEQASGGKVLHRLVDRDLHKDLSGGLRVCGGIGCRWWW